MSRLRRALFALTATAGSTVLTLVVLEGALRLAVPAGPAVSLYEAPVLPAHGAARSTTGLGKVEISDVATLFYETGDRGVRLRPNTDAFLPNWGYEGNVHIRSNSLGVRHEELPPKALDEFRILVLGDSIAFGAEVDEPQTFVAVMQEALKGRSKRVRVINAALPSSSTRDQVYRFLELRSPVKADLVLVGMYLNDAQNSAAFRVWSLPEPYRRSRLLSFLAAKSRLVTRFGEVSVRRQPPDEIEREAFWSRFAAGRTFPPLRDIPYAPRTRDQMDTIFFHARDDFGRALEPASWARIAPDVGALRDEAAADGARLRIALFPVRWQVEAGFLEERPQRLFRGMCAEMAVECLDLLPALRRARADGKAIHFDGCHLMKQGHAEVARRLVEWLDGLGDLPGPRTTGRGDSRPRTSHERATQDPRRS